MMKRFVTSSPRRRKGRVAIPLCAFAIFGFGSTALATSITVSNGAVRATFPGEPGNSYELHRTLNLLSWAVVAKTNPSSPGLVQIVDDFSDLGSQPPQAYYRLEWTPIPSFPLVGFATLLGSTSGGAGGGTTTVSTASEFVAAVTATSTGIVRVVGTITLTGNVVPRSYKTIVGLGTNATIVGDLNIRRATNVIVKNLHFTNPTGVGDGDGITIEESRNVWIDHCTFYDCADGALDITQGSDLVTVSWCKFFYTFDSGHNFVNLVGHSDNNAAEDAGKLRVTFHHNWWSTLCVERMPRVRFGRVHVFNNYFNSPGNNYCVRASIESELLVEHNYFETIDEPYEKLDPPGLIQALNNITVNCTGVQSFSDTVFTPPYSYAPDATTSVPGVVTNWAGAGKMGF